MTSGNQDMSMDLTTRLVTEGWQQVVCNPTFPTLVVDVKGTWWRAGTRVEAVDTPPAWTRTSFSTFHPKDLGINVYTP